MKPTAGRCRIETSSIWPTPCPCPWTTTSPLVGSRSSGRRSAVRQQPRGVQVAHGTLPIATPTAPAASPMCSSIRRVSSIVAPSSDTGAAICALSLSSSAAAPFAASERAQAWGARGRIVCAHALASNKRRRRGGPAELEPGLTSNPKQVGNVPDDGAGPVCDGNAYGTGAASGRAPRRRRSSPRGLEEEMAPVARGANDTAPGGAVAAPEATAAQYGEAVDPSAMKVSELQAALRALGLPPTGRKAELLQRLVAAQAQGQGQGQGQAVSTPVLEVASTAPQATVAAASGVRRARTRAVAVDVGEAGEGAAAVPAAAGATAAGATAAPAAAADAPAEAASKRRGRPVKALDSAIGLSDDNNAGAPPDGQVGCSAAKGHAPPSRAHDSGAAASAPVRRRRAAAKDDDDGAGSSTTSTTVADPFLDALFGAMELNVTVVAREPAAARAGVAHTTAGQSPAVHAVHASRAAPAATGDSLGGHDVHGPAAAAPEARQSLRAAAAATAAAAAATTKAAEGGAAEGRGPSLKEGVGVAREGVEGVAGWGGRRAARGQEEAVTTGSEDGIEGLEAPAAATSRWTNVAAASRGGRPPQDLDPDLGPAPDLSNLPPWPVLFMGQLRRPSELAPGDRDAQDEILLANAPGLSLTSLGTEAVRANAGRGLASLAMSRGKDIFIFDAGDDTQRRVAQAYHVKPSKIYRIFLTSLTPESVLGLPGLMCTINSARERGHELSDIPVHVYGPPGTADFLATMMRVSQTYLEITTVVHEIATDPVSPDSSEPYLYASRSRIWRVVVPPDQLNPRGGVDASLLLFAPDQGRSQKKKGRNAAGGVLAFDPRAGFQPWSPLEPGDPDRRDVDLYDMTWTLELDVTARVVISLLPGAGPDPVLSYTVLEAERAGALVVERATAAGLLGGRDFALLKAGQTVLNRWGEPVPPSLVISPNRPGRRVVMLGNTPDPSSLDRPAHRHARGADLLVAGTVFSKDEEEGVVAAAGTIGCTTSVLGEAVKRLGARYVLLSRFDGRRFGGAGRRGASSYTARLAAEVAEAAYGTGGTAGSGGGAGGCDGSRVVVLEDLDSIFVEKNDGPVERN